jgi:hypothetical protein
VLLFAVSLLLRLCRRQAEPEAEPEEQQADPELPLEGTSPEVEELPAEE